ncbi:MAG: long-chain fatty acid--CoA ligase [bacterium]
MIYQSFVDIVNRYPDKVALLYKKQGNYQRLRYRELKVQVDAVSLNLQKLGIGRDDAVGIFSYNRPEWVIADLATLKLGGIVVPIYHSASTAYIKYIIEDASLKLLFVENINLLEIMPGRFNPVVLMEPAEERKDLLDFKQLLIKSDFAPIDDRSIRGDDIATVVYTSGTTGEPKGVILSHNNIISNALCGRDRFNFCSKDRVLSYLPLSHMFERTCGYYAILFAGGTIAYAQNPATVIKDMQKIHPTIILVVPRVLEKTYQIVKNKIEKGSPLKRKLVLWTIKNLNKYINLRYTKQPIPLWLNLKSKLSDNFIGSKFRKIGGKRLKLIVSGGAPLNFEMAKLLHIFGFNIVEGYGLTEASPVVSSNTVKNNRLGSVGKSFEEVEVKIGKDDEILVRGPNVMKGYLNKPEETAKIIDKDGWLHTGDQGRFDEAGNLIITGRIKELIITSYGKKIAPLPIEAKICRSQYIEQVILLGESKKCLVALIVLNQEEIEEYARENNIAFETYSELLKCPAIIRFVGQEIEDLTADLAPYEKVKAFVLLDEGFTIENGGLTPTLKLRRLEIAKKYESVIERMYKGLQRYED